MHITDYDKIKELTDLCLFIFDAGDNIGTKTIFAKDLAKSIFSLVDAGTVSDAFVMGELERAAKYAADDKLLVGTSEGNKYAALSDIYEILDPVIPTSVRRMLYRGKNLGSVYTTEQKNEIVNRRYRGMFLGDFWEIGGQLWVISDYEYFTNYLPGEGKGPAWVNVGHLAITSRYGTNQAKIADTRDISSGYPSSYMVTSGLEIPRQMVFSAFGSENIIIKKESVPNNIGDNGQINGMIDISTDVNIMTLDMVYGGYDRDNKYVKTGTNQLSLFTVTGCIHVLCNQIYWLLNFPSKTQCTIVSNHNALNTAFVDNSNMWVRPCFGLTGGNY